mmetsp:Transcript_3065/g.7046  ORF Transcript_3065/g.7046 Transcript_3065/m.7046 type:complete len:349 (+) Transcript_3065:1241-2287(+)
MVPHLLAVLRRGEAQVHVGVAASQRTVLGHAVDAHRRQLDTQRLCQLRRLAVIRYDGVPPRLHVARIRPCDSLVCGDDPGHLQRRLLVHRRHHSPAALVRGEHHPGGRGGDLSGAPRHRLPRHVGAPQHASHHLALDHQRQCNGVLPPVDEPLGAVDGVQDPVAPRLAARRVAAFNHVRHNLLSQRPDLLALAPAPAALSRQHLVDEGGHLAKQRRTLRRAVPQALRALLRYQTDVRVAALQPEGNDSLGRKVSDGDGGVVHLLHALAGLQDVLGLHAQLTGQPHRLASGAHLVGERACGGGGGACQSKATRPHQRRWRRRRRRRQRSAPLSPPRPPRHRPSRPRRYP